MLERHPSQEHADKTAPSVAGRRRFLTELTAVAALPAAWGGTLERAAHAASEPAAPASTPKDPLPSIQLGPHRVSRLVAGANPLTGFSYQGSHTDHCMKEYFTLDRRVEFLQRCEQLGITAHQFSTYKDVEYVRVARDRGVRMSFWGLQRDIPSVKEAVQSIQPIALVHHGSLTDRYFHQGKQQQVHDFVKAAHDAGVMAGISAHNPDCIKRIADEGWDVDFFMTCFYFISREYLPGTMDKMPPVPTLDLTKYCFFKNDPVAMTAVVRQVNKPCFGFKIMAGGRACLNERRVREAFKYAFSNIKPTDGVIVGMFPRYSDEVKFNVEATRRYGQIPTVQRSKSEV
ncbi:MAG: hypothetical protein ABFC77_03270 [Thermoguttaceae bacterium]